MSVEGGTAPPGSFHAVPAYTALMSNRSLAILVALTAACGYPKSGAVPGPVSPTAEATAATRWPGTTPDSLRNGRELFMAKCNDCHGHPDITAIGEDHWPGILGRMGKKAKLTEAQTQDVLHFILAARSDATAK